MTSEISAEQSARKRALDVLAAAPAKALAERWAAFGDQPAHQRIRGPETGLVMVRGRIGGGGSPFNLGEVTVTRATIRLASGTVGHGQSLGTDRKKARLAAIFDALWQEEASRAFVEEKLLQPIARHIAAAAQQKADETAATRVDFFTMVRGED